MSSPGISIVVPTANRSTELEATLETIYAQDFPPSDFEVLVVENGPEGDARRVTARAASAHPNHATRYLHEPVPGLLSGRHRGALEARGEILVFVDDDIDAAPGWLAAIADSFSDPDIDLLGGRSLPNFQAPEPAWMAPFWWIPEGGGFGCGFLSLIDYGDLPREVDSNHIWGLNFAIRRQVLVDLRGFHPDTYPDEQQHFQGDGETGLTLKAQAARVKGHYDPRMLVRHLVPARRMTPGVFPSTRVLSGSVRFVYGDTARWKRPGGFASWKLTRGTPKAVSGPSYRAASRLAAPTSCSPGRSRPKRRCRRTGRRGISGRSCARGGLRSLQCRLHNSPGGRRLQLGSARVGTARGLLGLSSAGARIAALQAAAH
jgi:hypothetical protein